MSDEHIPQPVIRAVIELDGMPRWEWNMVVRPPVLGGTYPVPPVLDRARVEYIELAFEHGGGFGEYAEARKWQEQRDQRINLFFREIANMAIKALREKDGLDDVMKRALK